MDVKFTVLVADRDVLSLNFIGNLLAEHGYKTVLAESCVTMFDYLETISPDLIMVDSSVEDEDGYDAVHKLKSSLKYSNIPVIAILTQYSASDIDKVFEAGAVDYVFKPFSRVELIHKLKTYIELKTYNDTLSRLSRNISRAYEELGTAHKIVDSKNSGLNTFISELDHASRTDFLTNLVNRRHMIELINEEVTRARSTGRPFALLLADLDRFKAVNDTYGHDCGDEVLRSVSETFRTMVRENDTVARWGGEEFLFMAVEISESDAFAFGERIRSKVEKTPVFYNGKRIEITITIGVSLLREEPDSAHDVIMRADKALYAGKNAGRNRVVLSSV